MKLKKLLIYLLVAVTLSGSALTAYAAITSNTEKDTTAQTVESEAKVNEVETVGVENPVETTTETPVEITATPETSNQTSAVAEVSNDTGEVIPYDDDEIHAWYLGNDITAILTEGELTIWGEGRAWIDRPAGSQGYEYIPWIGDKRAQVSIRSVFIKDTVEIHDMGGWFWFCPNLTDISDLYIPDTCWRMDNTFYGCSGLTDVSSLNIPDSVTSLSGMLAHSGVTNVPDDLLPNKAKDISFLFCESDIKDASNLIIPETVVDAHCSFWKCYDLENINGIVIPAGANTFRMFGNDYLAAGTVTVKSTPSKYSLMFDWCGKDSSGVVVNYTDSSVIDEIVKTGERGNVTVGTLVN